MKCDNLEDIKLCRLCLSDSSISYPIFSEGSNLAEKILECTSIKIEQIEGVPLSICEICKSKLIICSQFVRQCHEIEQQIQEKYKIFFKKYKSGKKPIRNNINIIDSITSHNDERTDINQPANLDYKVTEEIEIIDYIPSQDEATIEQVGDIDSTSEVVLLEIIEEPNEESILILKNHDEIESKTIDRNGMQAKHIKDKLQKDEENTFANHEEHVLHTPEISKTILNPKERIDPLSQKVQDLNTKSVTYKQVFITENNDGIKKYKKPCPICGVLQQNLKQHMIVHSGAKKHICPFCSKAFSQKGNLTCHLNIHTGNKPHKCDQCDEAFGDPTALKMHKIKHTDKPKFHCDICQTALKYKHSLQTHMRSHRNERNHACTYCNMAFVTSSSLKKHIRTHTGERPYKCKSCPKTFISAGHLHTHMKTHLKPAGDLKNKTTKRSTKSQVSRKTKKEKKPVSKRSRVAKQTEKVSSNIYET
nr:zinc finger protein 85-like [Aedes albopictus]